MENETTPSALEALKAAEKATADARAALVTEAAELKTRLAAIHSALGRKPRVKKVRAAKAPVAVAAPPPDEPEPQKAKTKAAGR